MHDVGQELGESIPQSEADHGGDGNASACRGAEPARGEDENGQGHGHLVGVSGLAGLVYGYVVVNGVGQGDARPEEDIQAANQQNQNRYAEQHVPDCFQDAEKWENPQQQDDNERNRDCIHRAEHGEQFLSIKILTEIVQADGGCALKVERKQQQDDDAAHHAEERSQYFHDPTILGNHYFFVKVKQTDAHHYFCSNMCIYG